jgi:hypothetical protein
MITDIKAGLEFFSPIVFNRCTTNLDFLLFIYIACLMLFYVVKQLTQPTTKIDSNSMSRWLALLHGLYLPNSTHAFVGIARCTYWPL